MTLIVANSEALDFYLHSTSDFLFAGDEILAVNGALLHGLSHSEAIGIFKQIRSGSVVLQIGRRLNPENQNYQQQPHFVHNEKSLFPRQFISATLKREM